MSKPEASPAPQQVRKDLILKLGVVTVAKAPPEVYEEVLDELRDLEEGQIDASS